MEKKLISVIVPVYNVEAYLERCVDSILKQTYKELEIILVDDGGKYRRNLKHGLHVLGMLIFSHCFLKYNFQ